MAVGSIVTAIVVLGFAPRLLLVISLVWFAGGAFGFAALARRAREFGRFELDPERAELRQLRGSRLLRTRRFEDVLGYATLRDVMGGGGQERYDIVPRWIVLILRSGGRVRLGRGRPWELGPVLRALDDVGLASAVPPAGAGSGAPR